MNALQKAKAKRARRPISGERLRELFAYDPRSGQFERIARSGRVLPGDQVGSVSRDGYWRAIVDGKAYLLHRLAWLWVHGAMPELDIDHINGNRLDNRIANLRQVERRLNQENIRHARSHSLTGKLGAGPRDGKFRARINVRGKEVNLGRFATAEEAHEAYLSAKRRLHEGNTL